LSASVNYVRKIALAPCQIGDASQAILHTLRTLPFDLAGNPVGLSVLATLRCFAEVILTCRPA
jgi:hypothetical protein